MVSKMILIISEESDQSSNYVIDWLLKNKIDFYRINPEDYLNGLYIEMNDFSISVCVKFGDININLNDVSAYWYRRGIIKPDFSIKKDINPNITEKLNEHLHHECKTIEQFIVHTLADKHYLGDYFQRNANKLISLKIAQECGLKIPKTIVSNNKSDMLSFFEKNNSRCITKGVQDVMSFLIEDKSYFYCTNVVNKKDIEEMDTSFFPSLLQENVNKRYELRIFYIAGEFYSMAIFSQQDEQTQVDFRNYNDKKPNRNVPYQLPVEIETKLDKFMKKMQLNTGSIDMIVTSDYQYVFLEINPVGQYDMVSVPCNYYLHERIANYLINKPI